MNVVSIQIQIEKGGNFVLNFTIDGIKALNSYGIAREKAKGFFRNKRCFRWSDRGAIYSSSLNPARLRTPNALIVLH